MAEFISGGEFTPKDRKYATGPRGPRKRSAEQVPWDEAFVSCMAENGGNNTIFAQVKPDEAEDARKYVRAAARIQGRAVTEGEPQAGKTKGTVILCWRIRVPQPKKTASEDITETSA